MFHAPGAKGRGKAQAFDKQIRKSLSTLQPPLAFAAGEAYVSSNGKYLLQPHIARRFRESGNYPKGHRPKGCRWASEEPHADVMRDCMGQESNTY